MMRRRLLTFILAGTLLIAPAASKETISDFMRKHANGTQVTSAKSPEQLEFCLADGIADFLVVSVIRDGDDRTLFVSWVMDMLRSVTEVRRNANGSTVTVFTSGGYDERMKAVLRSCTS